MSTHLDIAIQYCQDNKNNFKSIDKCVKDFDKLCSINGHASELLSSIADIEDFKIRTKLFEKLIEFMIAVNEVKKQLFT